MSILTDIDKGIHRTIYCRANTPSSWFIRAMDNFGPYSHVAGILAEGEHVIEARAWHGVVITPLEDVIRRSSDIKIIDREVPNKAAGDAWALSTVGAGYDWLGAMSMKFGRDWESPLRHFCSEHNEMWMELCRLFRFVRERQHGVSPLQSFRVA